MKSLIFLLAGYLSLLVTILAQDKVPPFFSDSILTKPAPFAPGQVTGSAPTFTPDGRTVYTHTYKENAGHTIMVSHFVNGNWTRSETAEFSGKYDELEPFVTNDGSKLYFFSFRPYNGRNIGGQIWVMEKTDTGWAAPKPLESPITIQNSGSGVPSVSKNGTLYFGSTRRKAGLWPWEIYYSKLINGKYSQPVCINDTINSGYLSWSHCIAPDESYIIFASERPGGFGDIDLYISIKESNKWTPAKNLGPGINTEKGEVWPRLSPDGKYLFFNRQGEGINYIYQIDIKPILHKFKKSAKPNKPEESLKLPKIVLDSASVFYESKSTIHAIAFDKKGLMYAGGRHDVFTIKPDRSISHFITLSDTDSNTIIWSMTFDRDGNLYIAANDRIVKVKPDGTQKVIIQENFTGPCGVTDLRFDKKGNLYAVYDNIVAKYDPEYKKSIFIDGSKFPAPVKWAVGIEFSTDEEYLYIGDCGTSKVYIVPINTTDFYNKTTTYPTYFGQYFTKDKAGNIYLSSLGGYSNIPEFTLFKNHLIFADINCKRKPLQNDNNYKKTIAFGEKGFDEKAVYCIIGSRIYSYRLIDNIPLKI